VNRTLELIDGQVASILKSGKKMPKVEILQHFSCFIADCTLLDGNLRWRIW
jgi:hypothetical protein